MRGAVQVTASRVCLLALDPGVMCSSGKAGAHITSGEAAARETPRCKPP